MAAPLADTAATRPTTTTAAAPLAAPSGGPPDTRLALLDATIKRHRGQPDALLEVLHTAQELFGHLDRRTLTYVGRALRLPPSHVYGVATFYNFFSLKPKAAHTCVVCLGTACYVKGAVPIVAAVQQAHHIPLNGTTPDGQLSLSAARCIGACGLAPVVLLDNDIAGQMTPARTLARIATWVPHDR